MHAPADAITLATVAAARMDAHENTCTERYNRIASDTTEIKGTLRDIGRKLDESIQRIHSRVDEEASKARHGLNNATTTMQVEAKAAAKDAAAHADAAMAAAQNANDNVSKVNIRALTALVAVMGAIIAWAVDRLLR